MCSLLVASKSFSGLIAFSDHFKTFCQTSPNSSPLTVFRALYLFFPFDAACSLRPPSQILLSTATTLSGNNGSVCSSSVTSWTRESPRPLSAVLVSSDCAFFATGDSRLSHSESFVSEADSSSSFLQKRHHKPFFGLLTTGAMAFIADVKPSSFFFNFSPFITLGLCTSGGFFASRAGNSCSSFTSFLRAMARLFRSTRLAFVASCFTGFAFYCLLSSSKWFLLRVFPSLFLNR